jgi:hypothetical protein
MTRLVPLAVVALLWSCGSDVCTNTGKCSADPALTAAQIQTCRDASQSGAKCQKEYVDLADCLRQQQVCAADHTTDGAATLAKCQTQAAAFDTCSM